MNARAWITAVLLSASLPALAAEPPAWESLKPIEQRYIADRARLGEDDWASLRASESGRLEEVLHEARRKGPEREKVVLALADALRDKRRRFVALDETLKKAEVDERVLKIWLPDEAPALIGRLHALSPSEARTGPRLMPPSPRAAKARTTVASAAASYGGVEGAERFASDIDRSRATGNAPTTVKLASMGLAPAARHAAPPLDAKSPPAPLASGALVRRFTLGLKYVGAQNEDANNRASALGVARTEEGHRVLDNAPGFGKPGTVDLRYAKLDPYTYAVTGAPGMSGVPILINSDLRGSPDEKYVYQHELHHAGTKTQGRYGDMAQEYAAHLSATRSFIEDHPDFTRGFEAMSGPGKDKYLAEEYFRARVWADKLTETEREILRNPLVEECKLLQDKGLTTKKYCSRLESMIHGSDPMHRSGCVAGEPCGAYDGYAFFINAAYARSGEDSVMDPETTDFLRNELDLDLQFRRKHGLTLGQAK